MSAMHWEIPPGSIKSKNFFVVGNDTEHFAVAIMRCWGVCYVMYDTYTFGTASLTNGMVFFRKAQTAGAECQRSSLTAVYDLCWREQKHSDDNVLQRLRIFLYHFHSSSV